MQGGIIPNEDFLTSGYNRILSGDLNDYLTVGNYYIGDYRDVPNVANLPAQEPGRLIVINLCHIDRSISEPLDFWPFFIQWYITIGGVIYYRLIRRGVGTTIEYNPWWSIQRG